MMYGMGGYAAVGTLLWLIVVSAMLVALWRGMQAQEKMARHLEAIDRALAQRSAVP